MSGDEAIWRELPLGRDVQVLKRDENGVVAFAKPAGVLSHPNNERDESRALLTAPYSADAECFTWRDGAGAPRKLFLLNRLDSATSGVILAATNEQLARDIRLLFQQRHIRKIYQALVFGNPGAARQVWRDRLAIEKRGGKVRAQASAGHIPAEAHARVLRVHAGTPALALIELEPKTGRSHQLRVQCAKRHVPIVGDATYGDFGANRIFAKKTGLKRMFLHSLETDFSYEHAGRTYAFSARAPLPEEFRQALAS